MLAQADFQRALALALGEFAPAWTIVGECSPVDRLDASHWGSGPQSFQVTLRHRVTGHLKVLGRRVSYEPTASLHPAVALSLIGAYRHGNPEPIRRFLEEIGVAAVSASDANHIFRRPSIVASSSASSSEPAELRSTALTVAASISAPRAASAVGGDDGGQTDLDGPPQRASRPWSLSIRKSKSPLLPMVTAPAVCEVPPPRPESSRGVRESPAIEARKPMLGRLKRELEIWYWRRGASGRDRSHARD
jgi:hypothetical protein